MERKIYLKHEEIRVGVGSTSRSMTTENYFQVSEIDEDHAEIQLLDFTGQPLGKASVIPKETLKEYIYCPDYFNNKKGPKESAIERHVQFGDRHFDRKEFLSAEFEYDKALGFDDHHLRANLGKGKSLFARGRKEEGRKVFAKLSSIQTLFDKQNKHIFNEFGIELRKKGMFEEAIINYQKAISMDPNDEALRYNLGRAYYEKGSLDQAIEQLKSALTLRPDFKEAQEFLSKVQSP